MKFLILSSPTKTEEVYLLDGEDRISIIDGSNILGDKLRFKKTSKTLEQDIMEALIGLLPNKIYISNSLDANFSFIKRIENLFEGRVYKTK